MVCVASDYSASDYNVIMWLNRFASKNLVEATRSGSNTDLFLIYEVVIFEATVVGMSST